MQDEDIFISPMAADEIYVFLILILKHYASLTIYVIEPYLPQNKDVLKIPAGDNYTIHDFGGRLVIAPDDIYEVPFFSSGGLLNAVDQAMEILIDAGIKEIAVLGDNRAKSFVWDKCERLVDENIVLKLINYNPPEAFGKVRSAITRYLEDQGTKLRARLKKQQLSSKAGG